jgi:hypothetical protein
VTDPDDEAMRAERKVTVDFAAAGTAGRQQPPAKRADPISGATRVL